MNVLTVYTKLSILPLLLSTNSEREHHIFSIRSVGCYRNYFVFPLCILFKRPAE